MPVVRLGLEQDERERAVRPPQPAPPPTPQQRVLALQRLGGNQAVAAALRGGRVSRPMLQRAIGFEFEAPSWASWYLKRPLTKREEKQRKTQKRVRGLTSPQDYEPLKKKDQIAARPGYAIEADEADSGAGSASTSNVEFVTRPFKSDEEDALVTALDDMLAVCNWLIAYAGRRDGQGEFIWPDELRMIGGQGSTMLSGGTSGHIELKPQLSAGIRLSHIADVMTDIGTAQPGESPQEAQERDRGRKELITPGGFGADYVGAGPANAQAAIQAFAAKYSLRYPNATTAMQNDDDKLKGLLSLIYVYLISASELNPRYPKAIAPLMARTNFAGLYDMLDWRVRKFFRHEPLLWIELIRLLISNRLDLSRSVFERVMSDGTREQSKFGDRERYADLRRADWLLGMLYGHDLLSTHGYLEFLRKQGGPITKEQHEDAEWFEGMGAFGRDPDHVKGRTGHDRRAGVFELRAIPAMGKLAGGGVQHTHLKPLALDAFHYFNALNERKRNRRYGQRN